MSGRRLFEAQSPRTPGCGNNLQLPPASLPSTPLARWPLCGAPRESARSKGTRVTPCSAHTLSHPRSVEKLGSAPGHAEGVWPGRGFSASCSPGTRTGIPRRRCLSPSPHTSHPTPVPLHKSHTRHPLTPRIHTTPTLHTAPHTTPFQQYTHAPVCVRSSRGTGFKRQDALPFLSLSLSLPVGDSPLRLCGQEAATSSSGRITATIPNTDHLLSLLSGQNLGVGCGGLCRVTCPAWTNPSAQEDGAL